MPTTLSDGTDDDGRAPLPDSVDRVLGRSVPQGAEGAIIDKSAVARVRKALEESSDSNIDRLPAGDVDVLIDGTMAVRVVLDALDRRFHYPVERGETLHLAPLVR
jgi:hypothetical protein